MSEDALRERFAQVVWMNLVCSLSASGKNAKRLIMVGANDVAAAVSMAFEEVYPLRASASVEDGTPQDQRVQDEPHG